jgi:hypothetical protein
VIAAIAAVSLAGVLVVTITSLLERNAASGAMTSAEAARTSAALEPSPTPPPSALEAPAAAAPPPSASELPAAGAPAPSASAHHGHRPGKPKKHKGTGAPPPAAQ